MGKMQSLGRILKKELAIFSIEQKKTFPILGKAES